jgi:phosphatidylglycerol:prolipoprotein diacylglycerol transferase
VQLEGVLVRHTMPSDAGDLGLAADRLIATIQRGGATGAQAAKDIAPLLAARFPSQLLQAFFEGVVLTLVLWGAWWWMRRARAGDSQPSMTKPSMPKPGVIAGLFVLVYGVLRIIAEFYRLPDAQLGAFALGLSRGQWLSVLMVVIGAAWIVRAQRRARALLV